MSDQKAVDTVPSAGLEPREQESANIEIVGDAAVAMLDDVMANLQGVSTRKGTVLRMLGIFAAAKGAQILIQSPGEDPLVVKDLWQ